MSPRKRPRTDTTMSITASQPQEPSSLTDNSSTHGDGDNDGDGDNGNPQTQTQTQTQTDDKESSQPPNPVTGMFQGFRAELDEHHDRRERIIKASRDVTASSKKMVKTPGPLPDHIKKTIEPFQNAISSLFRSIIPDLQSLNCYRYDRQVSPGIQEFVEAVTFQHYLETGTLLSFHDAQGKLPDGILLRAEDYLGGVFDLSGEMMRFGINNLATGDNRRKIAKRQINEKAREESTEKGEDGGMEGAAGDGMGNTLQDLRSLRAFLEQLDGKSRGNGDREKLNTLRQSVEKVEMAVYGLVVRGSERPDGWMPDISSAGRED